jgi:hypothetical protein
MKRAGRVAAPAINLSALAECETSKKGTCWGFERDCILFNAAAYYSSPNMQKSCKLTSTFPSSSNLYSVHRTRVASSEKARRRRTKSRNNLKVKEETRSTLQCRNLHKSTNENAAIRSSWKGRKCQGDQKWHEYCRPKTKLPLAVSNAHPALDPLR